MRTDLALRIGDRALLARADIDGLIAALKSEGYSVIGPSVRNGAVVYAEIDDAADLPAGWTDRQEAGSYRLERRADEALFGYVAGAQSWKPFLFQPRRRLWRAMGGTGDFTIEEDASETPKLAFLGMRACELKAVSIQGNVFSGAEHPDADYTARREAAFFIAVNCGQAGQTCFCVSMEAGPRADSGYDLALTELMDDGRHDFLVEIGSPRGARLAALLPLSPAAARDAEAADAILARTAGSMGRRLETEGLKALLQENPEHPQWDDVAARCLSCANCTFVCPTCFCHTEEDVTDLDGRAAERHQHWDSCFSLEFSYIRGGPVRPGIASRYRQWMTHKLANWIDQFGEAGCVGCGRCITWCPAGIDITEEAAAIRASIGRE